jgi:hypothetical protein
MKPEESHPSFGDFSIVNRAVAQFGRALPWGGDSGFQTISTQFENVVF